MLRWIPAVREDGARLVRFLARPLERATARKVVVKLGEKSRFRDRWRNATEDEQIDDSNPSPLHHYLRPEVINAG